MTSDVAHAENMTSTQGLFRTGGKAVTTENSARSRPPTLCRVARGNVQPEKTGAWWGGGG